MKNIVLAVLLLCSIGMWGQAAISHKALTPKTLPAAPPAMKDYSTWDKYVTAIGEWAIDNGLVASQQINNPSIPKVGRYQIIINPNVRADSFLLDNATGRIWSPVQYTNVKGTPTVWIFQDRIDNPKERQDWEQTHLSP